MYKLVLSGRHLFWEENKVLQEFVRRHQMSTIASLNTTKHLDDFKAFVENYQVSHLHVNDVFRMPLVSELDRQAIMRHKAPETNVDNVISMYYNHSLAIPFIEDNDVVVLGRTDIVCDSMDEISKICILATQHDTLFIPYGQDYRSGINDQIAIGNGRVMKIYLACFHRMIYYVIKENVLFHPETLLKYHIQKSQLQVQRFHFPYSLNKNRHRVLEN
jgi:hypothetical protein